MTPELWQRVRQQFDLAKELTADKLADFLRQLRKDEPEVAREVEKMLTPSAADGEKPIPSIPTDLWAALAEIPVSAPEMIEPQDKWIGPYQVVAKIADGGMGIVYRCKDPKFHRSLALKVMLAKCKDDKEFRHRFEAEA